MQIEKENSILLEEYNFKTTLDSDGNLIFFETEKAAENVVTPKIYEIKDSEDKSIHQTNDSTEKSQLSENKKYDESESLIEMKITEIDEENEDSQTSLLDEKFKNIDINEITEEINSLTGFSKFIPENEVKENTPDISKSEKKNEKNKELEKLLYAEDFILLATEGIIKKDSDFSENQTIEPISIHNLDSMKLQINDVESKMQKQKLRSEQKAKEVEEEINEKNREIRKLKKKIAKKQYFTDKIIIDLPDDIRDNLPEDFTIEPIDLGEAEEIANEDLFILNEKDLIEELKIFDLDPVRESSDKEFEYYEEPDQCLSQEEKAFVEKNVESENSVIFTKDALDNFSNDFSSPEIIDITDNVVIIDDSDNINNFIESYIDDNKKESMKKLLSYLDGMFEKLPEEVIRNFAESDYFDLYVKIMNDLGV